MKIFITGATGFIGKYLVAKFLDEGNFVTINLRNEKKSPFDINQVNTYSLNYEDIEGDIQFFKREKFDGIIHLASLYITTHTPADINKLIESNIKLGSHILECATQANVKWFINTGTFWQNYENAVYSPVNLYAATKQAFESIAQYYIDTDKIKFVTLRLCDTYGPNDTRSKIFNLWNRVAKTGETLDMSPGEQLIDISYIDDVISAFTLLANQLNDNNTIIVNGSVYAVRAQKRYTLKQLKDIFEKSTHSKLKINWGTRPYRDKEVMIPWENGAVVPGWRPLIDIENGIKKIFE